MAPIRMRGRIYKIFVGRVNSNLGEEIKRNQSQHVKYLKSIFPLEKETQSSLSDCNLLINHEPCLDKKYIDIYVFYDVRYLFTQLSKQDLGIVLYKFQRYLNGLKPITEATQNTGMSTDATSHIQVKKTDDLEKQIKKVKDVLQGKRSK